MGLQGQEKKFDDILAVSIQYTSMTDGHRPMASTTHMHTEIDHAVLPVIRQSFHLFYLSFSAPKFSGVTQLTFSKFCHIIARAVCCDRSSVHPLPPKKRNEEKTS